MFVDNNLVMSDSQVITAQTATASTNIIDLGATDRNIRNDCKVICRVAGEAFDSSGDNVTLAVVLETDDDVSFGSATTLWTSATLAQATLVAGYTIFEADLSDYDDKLERYLRFTYQCGTADATKGKIDAFVVLDSHTA